MRLQTPNEQQQQQQQQPTPDDQGAEETNDPPPAPLLLERQDSDRTAQLRQIMGVSSEVLEVLARKGGGRILKSHFTPLRTPNLHNLCFPDCANRPGYRP